MPRTITAAMLAHLNQSNCPLAYCCLLTRRDGTRMGFTSANSTFVYQGVTYQGASAATATSVRSSQGTGVDNLDVMGVLDSVNITDVDLLAGRYDNAQVQVFVVNPQDLTMGSIILLQGNIGQIDFQDGTYTAEVRGLFQKLSQQIGEVTSPQCRVRQLGDSRCKLDLSPYSFTQTVTAVPNTTQILFASDGRPNGYYDYGVVESRSGKNWQVRREIKSSARDNSNVTLNLQLPFPFPVQVGDIIVVTAGCDRNYTTCRDKFNNLINFRGEPYVPGSNQTVTPGRPLG